MIEKAIYHYVDRDYSFDPQESLHALFLYYLVHSPWGDTVLQNYYRTVSSASWHLVKERIAKIRRINNACRTKKRVFLGLAIDEARLRADFELGADELFHRLEPGGEVSLPGSTETNYYLVFWSNYGEVKALLEKAGLIEYRHFADGTLLMPERLEDIIPDDRSVIWRM